MKGRERRGGEEGEGTLRFCPPPTSTSWLRHWITPLNLVKNLVLTPSGFVTNRATNVNSHRND